MYTGLLITRAYFNEKKENVKFHSVLPSKYEVGRRRNFIKLSRGNFRTTQLTNLQVTETQYSWNKKYLSMKINLNINYFSASAQRKTIYNYSFILQGTSHRELGNCLLGTRKFPCYPTLDNPPSLGGRLHGTTKISSSSPQNSPGGI